MQIFNNGGWPARSSLCYTPQHILPPAAHTQVVYPALDSKVKNVTHAYSVEHEDEVHSYSFHAQTRRRGWPCLLSDNVAMHATHPSEQLLRLRCWLSSPSSCMPFNLHAR